MNKKTRIPNPIVALTPLAVLVALLAMVIPTFRGDALLGGSQVSLLIASAVCVGIAMIKYNYKWSVLEEGMAKNIKKVTPAIVILLLIGAISGTWMLSGVVPTLIYYGLQILTPQFFLASCCIICAIVSIITGSSWTTIATIGMATARHRQGAGIRRGMDCRSNNIGSLFRRQDFAAVRHDSAGIVNNGHKAVYPHTLYAHNHRAVDNNHSRHIYRCRTCHEPQRQRAERAFCRHAGTDIQPVAVASAGAGHHGLSHSGQTANHHYALYIVCYSRNMHSAVPASHPSADSRRQRSRLRNRIQGPDDVNIRKHIHINGPRRNRRSCCHKGHARHDGHHLADNMCDVLRRRDVGKQHDKQHNQSFRAFCTQTR